MDTVFGPDEDFDPIKKEVEKASLIAEEYLQIIKIRFFYFYIIINRFPNRYFILKKITQDPDHWETCLQKNYVIITDTNYTRKLQNCFEVSDN